MPRREETPFAFLVPPSCCKHFRSDRFSFFTEKIADGRVAFVTPGPVGWLAAPAPQHRGAAEWHPE
jgi:hypothetical protein